MDGGNLGRGVRLDVNGYAGCGAHVCDRVQTPPLSMVVAEVEVEAGKAVYDAEKTDIILFTAMAQLVMINPKSPKVAVLHSLNPVGDGRC